MSTTRSHVGPAPCVPISCHDHYTYDKNKLPKQLFLCDNQCAAGHIVAGIHSDWALWVECGSQECTLRWFVCNRCSNARTKLTTTKAISTHARQQHKNGALSKKRKHKSDPECHFPEPSSATPDSRGSTGSLDGTQSPVLQADEYEENPDMSFDFYVHDENVDVFDTIEDDGIDWIDCDTTFDTGFYDNTGSHEYFHQCLLSDDPKGGMQYLVRRSLKQAKYEDAEWQKMKIPEQHVLLQMKIAKLAYSLTNADKELFVQVMRGSWEVGCQDGYGCARDLINTQINDLYLNNHLGNISTNYVKENCKPFKQCLVTRGYHEYSTRIPSTVLDIRRYHTEFSHAIVTNLPIPHVRQDISGHAYVSLIDCIRHFLGHYGHKEVATIRSDQEYINVTHITESWVGKRAFVNARLNDQTIAMYILFWGDDCDPNAFNKLGRGSVWVKTMTIGTLKDNGHSTKHTYPLAVGKKADYHDDIERFYATELEVLKSPNLDPFYVGTMKKKATLHFELIATLQDQPERRSANHIHGGGGLYAARFGVSADLRALQNVLPACSKCLETIETNYREQEWNSGIPNCTECLNWDVLQDLVIARTPIPDNYPSVEGTAAKKRTISADGEQFLLPFVITYEGLRTAAAVAHSEYLGGRWNENMCDAYLRVECIDDKTRDSIIDNAKNARAIHITQCEEERQFLLDAKEQNPAAFEPIPTPPLWSRDSIELWSHVDTIMHLLFLGVVKTLVFTIQKWLLLQSLNAGFMRANRANLDPLSKLTIDWLPIQPFVGGKLGIWVSENYLAFSRISMWFYQNIGDAEYINDDEPPMHTGVDKWLVKHLKYWLRMRGLDEKGLKKDLLERVQVFMRCDPPPALLPIPEKHPADVEAAIVTMVELLDCIMSRTVSEGKIRRTELAIRIFLSKFDHLDKTMRGRDQVCKVVSKYNFACLINLPKVMERYGPLRELWEGGPRGEGYALNLKRQMNQGFRLNWEANLMKTLLRHQAFDNIIGGLDTTQPCPLNSAEALRDRKASFYKYKSSQQVREFLAAPTGKEKKPISVIYLDAHQDVKDTRIYAVVGDYHTLLEIEVIGEHVCGYSHKGKFGLEYYKYKPKGDDICSWDVDVCPDLSHFSRIGYGILLPLLEDGGGMFALVASNWKSLRSAQSWGDLFEE